MLIFPRLDIPPSSVQNTGCWREPEKTAQAFPVAPENAAKIYHGSPFLDSVSESFSFSLPYRYHSVCVTSKIHWSLAQNILFPTEDMVAGTNWTSARSAIYLGRAKSQLD